MNSLECILVYFKNRLFSQAMLNIFTMVFMSKSQIFVFS